MLPTGLSFFRSHYDSCARFCRLNPQEIPPEGLSAFAKKQNRKSAALVRFSVLSQDLENEMGRRSRGGSFNTATASGAVKFAPEVGTSDASAALQVPWLNLATSCVPDLIYFCF